MQGVMAPTVYAAIFVISNGVEILPGPLPQSTLPDAVAIRKSQYLVVAAFATVVSFAGSTPHLYTNEMCKMKFKLSNQE
jgi:hypothetical protein